MPLRPTLSASLAACFGAACVVVVATAAPALTVFDLTLAGLPLGTVTLDAEQSGAEYAAVSRITPNGVVNLVAGYAFDGRATGRIDAEGRISPLTFEADSTSPRASRRTEIEWRDGAPVRVSVEPPRQYAADPARVAGALDPVSAGFALLRDNAPSEICDTTIDVFDGSRRSRLSLGKPVAAGAGVTCTGLYARLEGEAHSLSSQTEYPFTLTFTPTAAGQVQLQRIETRTRFGLAVVDRRG